MQKNISFLICFIFLFSSCHSDKKIDPNSYLVKPTDTQLVFPLDNKTKIYIYSMQDYIDPSGEEYLVFQNENYDQLLFYKMNNQQLYKKINCTREGPEAVSHFCGFFVRNMDEIYVTHSDRDGITVINGEGKPVKVYQTKSKEGKGISTAVAVADEQIQEINNMLYLPLGINWGYGHKIKFQHSNLCATFNLENQKIETLPLTHFDILGKEDENIYTMLHSRCTNRKQFVYSFHDTDDIFITDLAHTTLQKIKVKSKYLSPLKFKPQKMGYVSPDNCTNMAKPRYGNILYDPYRKVYYRIAFPKTDIEKGINCMELDMSGGKKFSIMILNEDFQIIGETLMPDYTYNSTLCFVRPDGLYISESHVLNPNFDENKLCFRRFELVKNK